MARSLHADVAAACERSPLAAAATCIVVRDGAGRTAAWSSGPGAGPDEPFYAASLTKQVVGLLLALLVDEQAVDPDAPVAIFLPELPAWARSVSPRQLAHHTGGLPSTPTLREAGLAYDEAWDNAAVLAWLSRTDVPLEPPGRSRSYANLGYICLAAALERVARRPLAGLVHDRLLAPAAMAASRLLSDPDRPALRVLRGRPAPPRSLGDGGLWTTARDLSAWNLACNARRFGPRAHTLAETTGRLADGTAVDYGWGIALRTVAGRPAFSHGGWVPGFASKLVRQPGTGADIVIVTDLDDVDSVHALSLDLAERLAPAGGGGG